MIAPRWFAVAAAGFGLVLIAAAFLPWYEPGSGSRDMWQSFTVVDIIVSASAGLAVAAGITAVLAEQGGWAVVVCTLAADLALVALALLVWRAIDVPLEGEQVVPATGLWVGLAAQAGVLITCVLGVGAAPRR